MTSPRISNKRMRDVQRFVHLLGAAFLIAFIYSPAGDYVVFERVVQFAVIPVVSITGILIWKMPQIRKAFRARDARTSGE